MTQIKIALSEKGIDAYNFRKIVRYIRDNIDLDMGSDEIYRKFHDEHFEDDVAFVYARLKGFLDMDESTKAESLHNTTEVIKSTVAKILKSFPDIGEIYGDELIKMPPKKEIN